MILIFVNFIKNKIIFAFVFLKRFFIGIFFEITQNEIGYIATFFLIIFIYENQTIYNFIVNDDLYGHFCTTYHNW